MHAISFSAGIIFLFYFIVFFIYPWFNTFPFTPPSPPPRGLSPSSMATGKCAKGIASLSVLWCVCAVAVLCCVSLCWGGVPGNEGEGIKVSGRVRVWGVHIMHKFTRDARVVM